MYAKIFEQIYDSSIADNWRVRVVFQDMLILADYEGFVDKTHEALARRTRLPLKMIRDAISALEKPDPQSRSLEYEGRRIVRIDEHRDWGWKIVNYEAYRSMREEFDRTQYMKHYMRQRRAVDDGVKPVKPKFNKLDDIICTSVSASGTLSGGTQGVSEAGKVYALYPRKVGKPVALRAIEKALKAHGFEHVVKATESFANAWKSAPPEELQFCPHPSTWFNQERYNDSPETWQRKSGGRTNGAPGVINPAAERRNAGTIGGTDYGEAGRRKLARQEADRLARESAANEP